MECESGRDRISPNDFRMLRYVQCLPVFQRKLINNTHIYSSRSLANRVLHGQVERTSPKTLTEEQCLFYEDNGYVVVKRLFNKEEIANLVEATEDFLQRSAKLSESSDVFILSSNHRQNNPVLERVICPSLHHPTFGELIRCPKLLDIVEDLIGPSFRYMPQDKLNAKPSFSGLPIPWHQDWAFFPHTNDSVLTVSVIIDDSTRDNGCLQVIPGSQKGPLYDHFKNGCFASAITDEVFNPKGPTFLEAPAGSITIHHARIVHASAANSSEKPRRVACFTYTAMDAWPLLGVAGPNFLNIGPVSWDLFNATLVRGAPTEYPRLKPCPVKLPLPLQDPTTVIDTFSGKEIPQQSY